MALRIYYMYIGNDSTILSCGLEDHFPTLRGGVVESASFSLNPADSPDVLREEPKGNDQYTSDPPTYTPKIVPYIKQTWSGDGTLVGDVYEMTPHGANVATLTLQKWDENADTPLNTGGEVYWICVGGVAIKPNVGKVTLDGSGQGAVSFTPEASDLGMAHVNAMCEDTSAPRTRGEAKLGLA